MYCRCAGGERFWNNNTQMWRNQVNCSFNFMNEIYSSVCSNQIFAVNIILIPVEIETERKRYKRMKNGRKMVLLENMFPAVRVWIKYAIFYDLRVEVVVTKELFLNHSRYYRKEDNQQNVKKRRKCCNFLHHCKKAFRYSRPQPGCHLPNSP